MRIRADERIRIGFEAVSVGHRADNAREIFDVYLVADAGVGWNYFEISKCLCAPAEEGVALDIALEFEFGVQAEGVGAAETVHLDGVIDDEFRGEERIDALGIAAHLLDGFAHGGEIDHRGNASEVLEKDACGHEGNFFLRTVGSPFGKRGDVVFAHEAPVFTAEEIFEEDAQRERKLGEMAESLRFESFEAMNFEGLRANVQFVSGSEGIGSGDRHTGSPFQMA